MCYCRPFVSCWIQLGSCVIDRPSFHGTRPSESSLMFLKAKNFSVNYFVFNCSLTSGSTILASDLESRVGSSACTGPYQVVSWLRACTQVTLDAARTLLPDSFNSWWGYCRNLWQYFIEIHFAFESLSYFVTPSAEEVSSCFRRSCRTRLASSPAGTAPSGQTASCCLVQT